MMLNKTLKRKNVDNVIDFVRFRMDTFPSMDYQPLPWLNIKTAKRSAGVQSRWQVMAETINQMNVQTALDIGCNVGYFSISLAQQGVNVISVETYPKYFRILQYAINSLKLNEKIGILSWKITPSTVSMLPTIDCTLFLSVWHHIVREYGLDLGTQVLQDIWAKTNKILFFETGETEMPAEYNLPKMAPDPRTYLDGYLNNVCHNGEVRHLGMHDAFAPNGTWAKRNLFAVTKKTQ